MRNRNVATVVVLALLVVTGFAGVRLRPAIAAPLAQAEFVRASIHPGTCVRAQPAVVTLERFTQVPVDGGAVSSMTSYTQAPVPLPDLLESPHTVLVTLGGDPRAVLACGDLIGRPAARSVNVELRQQNESGLSGIGLLVAAGEETRVSILLDEVLIDSPAAPSPTVAAATPVPVNPTEPPAVTETPTTPEPTASPEATVVPVASPVGTTTGTPSPDAESYTSQEFGYSIAFDDPWRLVAEPVVREGSDYVAVTNGTSVVDFVGLASEMTAPACLDVIYDYLPSREGVFLVTSHTGAGAASMVSTPELAVDIWDVVYRDANGEDSATTLFARCQSLVPGQAMLVTTHEAPTAIYAAEAALREQLYEGLILP